MAQSQTIARPYARAVFGRANTPEQQQHWHNFLNVASQFLANESVQKRLSAPNFIEELNQWLNAWLNQERGSGLNQEEQNFLSLLAHHERLTILPEITEQYHQLWLDERNICQVAISSAQDLSQNEIKALQSTLEKKIGREVVLNITVRPELIAGVLIEYDGQVIDQTVRGRIASFAQMLN